MTTLHSFTLALDWTPNTNHTGFYVARAKGFYAEAGLELHIHYPKQENYGLSPAKQLAQRQVDFAIAPSESVISYHSLTAQHPKLKAIATLLQEDSSAIVTLATRGLDRPATLDGKIYASYSARFEDAIVKQMIRNDGGKGEIQTLNPERLGIPATLETGQADATWVFMPWEGIEVKRRGIEFQAFRMADYNVPYGYTPLLLAHPEFLENHAEQVRAFLAATQRGYHYAAAHPEEAAHILCDETQHTSLEDRDFVVESQQCLSADYYLNSNQRWGYMLESRWQDFVDWLLEQDILTHTDGSPLSSKDIKVNDLFSNAYLP